MPFVVLMGGPGAGKGTQARQLKETLGLPQIATGDLFRENLQNETELGKLAKRYMDAGELVPDEVTVAMVKERLSRPDCANGALLDGFPRTIAQARALDQLLAEMGERISLVPYIHVDPDVLLRRLAGRWTCRANGHVFHLIFNPPKEPGICDYDGSPLYQRADDSEETQKRRIEVYFEQTAPLLDYYRDRGLLVEIDGEQDIEQVHRDLVAAIQKAS
ncbi:MAG: adenylate kinase [Chloroflexi bacterium]|nr:adenylate kinase [Chloroflexota bacterium]MCI0580477.1 adenylate kinase [Chloroflexota bacterium]MCI0649221.1 adenylate kinase [Chloroflexota bacterium]MCI0727967.1 adenylate kinase [Chloroflexota bacterium]